MNSFMDDESWDVTGDSEDEAEEVMGEEGEGEEGKEEEESEEEAI